MTLSVVADRGWYILDNRPLLAMNLTCQTKKSTGVIALLNTPFPLDVPSPDLLLCLLAQWHDLLGHFIELGRQCYSLHLCFSCEVEKRSKFTIKIYSTILYLTFSVTEGEKNITEKTFLIHTRRR